MIDRMAIRGLQLERTAGVYQMSWWQRDEEATEWRRWALRLTKAEAEMVMHCNREQIWTEEFEALLKRGAPPMGAWVP